MLPPRFRKTEENRLASEEKYLPRLAAEVEEEEENMALLASSSVTELGREESHSGRSRRRSAAAEEAEDEELPLESRDAVVAVVSVEEDEVEDEASKRVRTMVIRGVRWKGRSWPL